MTKAKTVQAPKSSAIAALISPDAYTTEEDFRAAIAAMDDADLSHFIGQTQMCTRLAVEAQGHRWVHQMWLDAGGQDFAGEPLLTYAQLADELMVTGQPDTTTDTTPDAAPAGPVRDADEADTAQIPQVEAAVS